MNTIAVVPAIRGEVSYFDIVVDGKPLAQHFVGAQGGHPSELSPLGWSSASALHRAETVAQLLGQKPSPLESGRVPVLVCEECGDLACGALAVRIVLGPDRVIWSDWQYENGYEAGHPLEWPAQPGELVFETRSYEVAIRGCV